MRGHVVGSLGIVRVIRGIFGSKLIEMALQVRAHGRVGVLVDRQGRGCVLNEKMKYPPTHGGELREARDDLGCDEMKPPLPGREYDLFLYTGHSEGRSGGDSVVMYYLISRLSTADDANSGSGME